jgi:hypothetical protein
MEGKHMAKYENCGIVNISLARETILRNGGGENVRTNWDGSIHHSLYLRTTNWHLSYDEYPDGHFENVHSDKNNSGYMDYKDGY